MFCFPLSFFLVLFKWHPKWNPLKPTEKGVMVWIVFTTIYYGNLNQRVPNAKRAFGVREAVISDSAKIEGTFDGSAAMAYQMIILRHIFRFSAHNSHIYTKTSATKKAKKKSYKIINDEKRCLTAIQFRLHYVLKTIFRR